jgi:hypothetical protein
MKLSFHISFQQLSLQLLFSHTTRIRSFFKLIPTSFGTKGNLVLLKIEFNPITYF